MPRMIARSWLCIGDFKSFMRSSPAPGSGICASPRWTTSAGSPKELIRTARMYSPLQIEGGCPAGYLGGGTAPSGRIAPPVPEGRSGSVFLERSSSSGENTRRAARPVCDKRLNCGSRIVARHDRTDHFEGGPVGSAHALVLPSAKYGLHSVVGFCWTSCQPRSEEHTSELQSRL